MNRKTAYRHPVSSYQRQDGKRVDNYWRGTGDQQTRRSRVKPGKASGYSVTWFYPGGSEFYSVDVGDEVTAALDGIKLLQAPQVPSRVRIVRRSTSK